jgi:hypothetical protein
MRITATEFSDSHQRLIYVAGWGRSGSTIVANVLSAVVGGAALGEVRYLWDRGLIENRLCGCGSAVRDCEVWRSILNHSAEHVGLLDPQRMAGRVGAAAIWSQLAALMLGRLKEYRRTRMEEIRALQGVYSSALATSGTHTLIDASKSAPYLLNLLDQPGTSLCVLHLVRDPRAVAYSWMRRKSTEESDQHAWFPRYSTLRSALSWTLLNAAACRFEHWPGVRYLRVNYEDFCAQPRQTMKKISRAFGLRQNDDAWIDEYRINLKSEHSISGNPSRFHTGHVCIRLDNEWEKRLPVVCRFLVHLICGRLMRRFGYSRIPTQLREQPERLPGAS